jgi:hypothetical protein
VTNISRESLDPAVFDPAIEAAKKDITRGSEANDIMTSAMTGVLRNDPTIDQVRSVATLISAMIGAEQEDVLLMWAILITERAEAQRHGS